MKHSEIYSWDPRLDNDPVHHFREKFKNKTSHRLFSDTKENYKKIRHKFTPELQKEYDKPIEYLHNNLGFRDHRNFSDSNNGILALGDSFTEGEGVAYHNLWTQLVEKEINTPVYNLGLCNTGFDEWFRVLLRHISKFTDKRILLLSTMFSRYSLPNVDSYKNPNCEEDYKDMWNYYFVCDNLTYYNYQIKMLAMYQLAAKCNKTLIVINLSELLEDPTYVGNSFDKYSMARDGKHFGADFHREVSKMFCSHPSIY